VNTPMLTLALPLDEQPLAVAVTLIDTGVAVPTEKAIDEFFADKPESVIPIPDRAGTAAIRKIG